MDPLRAGDQLLDELANTPRPPLAGESMRQIAKVSYTHAAMVDMIVANPKISQTELARHFGYTQAWICQIIASDAFQALLAERKDELIDPALRLSIEERFKALVSRSLEILQEKLSAPSTQISDTLAIRAAELGARSLGIGHTAPPPAAPPGDRLLILSDRLVNLLVEKREVIHGEAKRLPETAAQAAGGPEQAGREAA